MNILEVTDLKKQFKKVTAVDNVSFELREGEILGFLGPNGAGKTTTIQMLTGTLTPTAGKIEYFGKSLFSHREEILDKINYSTTYTSLPSNLSVRESLKFISYLYSIKNRKKRIEEIVEIFKLEELMHMTIGNLSAGQKTRVNLAKAFINFPKVLLLDEPTASLDPDIAKYLREFIKTQQKEYGVSVLFTSHNMREVEEICSRVVFINKGKIIANDTPQKLAQKIDETQIELLPVDQKGLQIFCEKHAIQFSLNGDYVTLLTTEKEVPKILHLLSSSSISYTEISINKPTLEDYFLKVSTEEKL